MGRAISIQNKNSGSFAFAVGVALLGRGHNSRVDLMAGKTFLEHLVVAGGFAAVAFL